MRDQVAFPQILIKRLERRLSHVRRPLSQGLSQGIVELNLPPRSQKEAKFFGFCLKEVVMLLTNKKILGTVAAIVMSIGMAVPATAKSVPINKHGHKHHGRNVAIGLAAATAAAIAAGQSGSSCRRWERQCDDGSRRACRKYQANCE